MSEFNNSFVETMMSNDEKSGNEEPLSLVQSLRIRMDEMGDCQNLFMIYVLWICKSLASRQKLTAIRQSE